MLTGLLYRSHNYGCQRTRPSKLATWEPPQGLGANNKRNLGRKKPWATSSSCPPAPVLPRAKASPPASTAMHLPGSVNQEQLEGRTPAQPPRESKFST